MGKYKNLFWLVNELIAIAEHFKKPVCNNALEKL